MNVEHVDEKSLFYARIFKGVRFELKTIIKKYICIFVKLFIVKSRKYFSESCYTFSNLRYGKKCICINQI